MNFFRITFRIVILYIMITTYEIFGRSGEGWQYFLSLFGVFMLWNLYDWYLKEKIKE